MIILAKFTLTQRRTIEKTNAKVTITVIMCAQIMITLHAFQLAYCSVLHLHSWTKTSQWHTNFTPSLISLTSYRNYRWSGKYSDDRQRIDRLKRKSETGGPLSTKERNAEVIMMSFRQEARNASTYQDEDGSKECPHPIVHTTTSLEGENRFIPLRQYQRHLKDFPGLRSHPVICYTWLMKWRWEWIVGNPSVLPVDNPNYAASLIIKTVWKLEFNADLLYVYSSFKARVNEN